MTNTPVLCPTREYHGMPAQTMLTLCLALGAMDRRIRYFQGGGCLGYASTRNFIHQTFKSQWPELKNPRGFWIDDDMLLVTPPEQFRAVIEKADKHGWNIVAPYRNTKGQYMIMDTNGDGLTQEALTKLETWDEVPAAGLGFYYGTLPTDYLFHEFPVELGKGGPGEDHFFFKDNALKPRLAPLEFKHIKTGLF